MGRLRTRRILAWLTATIALVLFSGCSQAAPVQADVAAVALAVSAPSEKTEVLGYLQAAEADFGLIDELLSDKDLALLEDEEPSDEEVTAEVLDWYLDILNDYGERIDAALQGVGSRAVPDYEELRDLKAAEEDIFKTTISIVDEYVEVLEYYKLLVKVGEGFDQISYDTDDLQAMYEAISAGITQAINDLNSASVPSFLASMNAHFADALAEMNDAVLYSLNAVALDDPLRADAAEYRMGILDRKLDKITADSEQDMNDREEKLKQQLEAVKAKSDGLSEWVQKNIDKLD